MSVSASARYQPKSGGLAVLDAAASRGKHHRALAALASSEHGPRVKRLANLQHYKEGKSGVRYFTKILKDQGISMSAPIHVHDHLRKYSKRTASGIAAHKVIYGGGGF
ncbi:MAG: hypothetical protein V3R93_07835 [Candidatus Hydrothermarchaeaceae archaeon]